MLSGSQVPSEHLREFDSKDSSFKGEHFKERQVPLMGHIPTTKWRGEQHCLEELSGHFSTAGLYQHGSELELSESFLQVRPSSTTTALFCHAHQCPTLQEDHIQYFTLLLQ